ncbi:hypothetical protein TNCV_4034531 [Trichonephila clavipes]|nr:hypothetical protein TNCV_4034531 [Trichonephila clavipes]
MTIWEYTSTGLAWLLTSPEHSEAMTEWVAITCSNALDLLNTQLVTSKVGTGGSASNGQEAKHKWWINK